ncbi:Nuclear aminoacylation-dependent tRNA export pathway component [Coemansia sp. RSA 2336]|nr:Nuclear aminoacylation-dependent tRNA export pathway component [Coemansia sp. RSA 2336]
MSGLSSYLFSTLSRVGGLGGSGVPDFHFTLGEKLEFPGKTLWQVHLAQSTNGKQEATVFVFDKGQGASHTAAAQNALKRMRTLRHPNMLKYLEGVETAEAIYIATEAVVPLVMDLNVERDGSDELIKWGLFKVAEALKFINEDCKLVHGNMAATSVFVTRAGEWRVGGLELADVAGSKDNGASQQMYRQYTSVIPGYAARMAPEMAAQNWALVEGGKLGALDGWGLAVLIYEIYNGELHAATQMQTQGQIPQSVWQLYRRLCATDMRRRATAAEFLQAGQQPGGFFDSKFVRACQFIENVAVKEEDERREFFAGLDTTIAEFPAEFTKHKILPELLKMIEFGGIGSREHDAKVLSSVIQIGKRMDEDEYNRLVAPAIVQLFGSNDRALRFNLLEHMGGFIESVPQSLVLKKVYPDFAAGFLDGAPAIREATVKAALVLAPKLNQKTLNGDLMRQLVRLVADAEPGIRTNSLICIGKLCMARRSGIELEGEGVTESTVRFVVCPALLHALRDQFPPVRSAALSVASACAGQLDAVELSRRVVPAISPLLVDGELPVRSAAFKAMNAMISRIDEYAKSMPETSSKGPVPPGKPSVQTQASMAAAADGWSGWAVSSLSSTITGALSLASSSLPIGQAQPGDRPPSAPATAVASQPPPTSPRNSTTVSSPTASISKPPPKPQQAIATKSEASGWDFDDNWDDSNDAWGLDDDDLETELADEQPGASSQSGAGGMATRAAPIEPASVSVSKTSAKLAKPASTTTAFGATSQAAKPVSRRTKGLGAMKLGGAKKNSDALLDQLL